MKAGKLKKYFSWLVLSMGFAHCSLDSLIQEEKTEMIRQASYENPPILTEQDIRKLPPSIRKWIRYTGMMGKPVIHTAHSTQSARMKIRPNQENWMKAHAEQISFPENPGFIWWVKVSMNPFVAFQGRDRFWKGKGEMKIRINRLFNVVDARGEKIDEGSLQRYLGEIVWYPSGAISPYITWEELEPGVVEATMEYNDTKGSGKFFFRDTGEFYKFSAMRFQGNDPESVRREWVIENLETKEFQGIKIPAKMQATWKLPEGDWKWLELDIESVEYNGELE